MTLTCPCGAIELKVEGKPLAQFYCHCDDCRKTTSGAYAAESVHRANEVTVTRGAPAVWTLARNPMRHDRGTERTHTLATTPRALLTLVERPARARE